MTISWQPVDCHAHSTFSDGALTVDEVVQRAAERGVAPSVSDHISRDVPRTIDSLDGVRAYLDALEAAPVRRGGEFCWHDALWRELPANLVRRFTHRIGSLHAIQLSDGSWVHAFARQLPEGLDPQSYMDHHIATLERFAAEMPVDILAHPTLVTLAFRRLPTDDLWTEERETRLVEALFRAGIAFELSSRYPPHERLVRRAAARGVRLSVGSDGHTAEQVARVDAPLALARAIGYADTELYDPLRHGSRTGIADMAHG